MVAKKEPNSTGAERYVITCCLNAPESVLELSNQLTSDDFYNDLYRYTYQICLSLLEKEMIPEPMTIFNYMERMEVSKPDYLRELELIKNASYDLKNMGDSVEEIKAASARRQLIVASEHTISKLRTKDKLSPSDAIALAEEEILEVSNKITRVTEVYKIGQDAIEVLKVRAENPVPVPGLPTGFAGLDTELQGLQPGRLYVVAGRFKSGKSMFLLNVAAHVGLTVGEPVLIIDTENTSAQIDDRFLSLVSGVEEDRIRNGMFVSNPEEKTAIWDATKQLKAANIYHHYMPDFTFDACLSLIRRYVATKGVKLVIFDYIKTPDDVSHRDNREDQSLGYLTSNLHNKVAGKLSIPVMTAAQLGRGAVGEKESEVHVADSDRIGRYTDVLIYWKEKTEEERVDFGYSEREGTHVCSIMANRSGPSKSTYYDMYFDKPRMKIKEVRARRV